MPSVAHLDFGFCNECRCFVQESDGLSLHLYLYHHHYPFQHSDDSHGDDYYYCNDDNDFHTCIHFFPRCDDIRYFGHGLCTFDCLQMLVGDNHWILAALMILYQLLLLPWSRQDYGYGFDYDFGCGIYIYFHHFVDYSKSWIDNVVPKLLLHIDLANCHDRHNEMDNDQSFHQFVAHGQNEDEHHPDESVSTGDSYNVLDIV